MSGNDPFLQLADIQSQAGYRETIEEPEIKRSEEVDYTPPTEQQLLVDPTFQGNAKILYDDYQARLPKQTGQMSRNGPRKVLTNPEEISQWAVNKVATLNGSFTQMTLDYSRMRTQSPESLQALMSVWDAYDATPNTLKQAGRGLANVVSDPATWFGFGLLGKAITKGMGKQVVKGHIRNLIRSSAPVAAVAGAEGGVASGGLATARESLSSKATGKDFDATQPMIYTGTGVIAGATLGAAVPAVAGAVKQGYRAMKQGYTLFRGANKTRSPLDTKQANGAPTLSDTPEQASKYGKAYKVDVDAWSPAIIDADVTPEEVMQQFDLQPEDIANGFDSPEFADALRERGFDLIQHTEDNGENVYTLLDPDIVKNVRTVPKRRAKKAAGKKK